MELLLKKIEYKFKTSIFYNVNAYYEIVRERALTHSINENQFHITEAIQWVKRAQEATSDDGVSRSYRLSWGSYFKSKGWQSSYPETTGYIIPTFFDCAKFLNDHDLFQRAVKMAEWEIKVQMKNGAVRGGVVGHGEPVPAVFCTGQVIFGWVRAYQETNEISFINAAKRAGDFLLEVQNEEGKFIENENLKYSNKNTTIYHTRVAWALILLGKVTNNDLYIIAGEKNIEYALNHQFKNGWFANNCLANAELPLLHTICYAIRGILEAGKLLSNDRYIESAKLAADHLLKVVYKYKIMPGRLDKNWECSENWSCLTGDAQLAIILLKLYQQSGDTNYLKGADKLISFLKSTQNCSTSNLGLRGGIKGSFPVNGPYGRFQIINWATKFFIDSLLIRESI